MAFYHHFIRPSPCVVKRGKLLRSTAFKLLRKTGGGSICWQQYKNGFWTGGSARIWSWEWVTGRKSQAHHSCFDVEMSSTRPVLLTVVQIPSVYLGFRIKSSSVSKESPALATAFCCSSDILRTCIDPPCPSDNCSTWEHYRADFRSLCHILFLSVYFISGSCGAETQEGGVLAGGLFDTH